MTLLFINVHFVHVVHCVHAVHYVHILHNFLHAIQKRLNTHNPTYRHDYVRKTKTPVFVVINKGGIMRTLFLISALAVVLTACEDRDRKKESNDNRPTTERTEPRATTGRGYERTESRATTGRGYDYDNTAVNVRDRETGAKTPFSQPENSADLETLQKIRRAIRNEPNLSTNAQNVKIIVIEGVATLRGPVASAQEKRIILQKAQTTPGVSRVEDQIDVTRNYK